MDKGITIDTDKKYDKSNISNITASDVTFAGNNRYALDKEYDFTNEEEKKYFLKKVQFNIDLARNEYESSEHTYEDLVKLINTQLEIWQYAKIACYRFDNRGIDDER